MIQGLNFKTVDRAQLTPQGQQRLDQIRRPYKIAKVALITGTALLVIGILASSIYLRIHTKLDGLLVSGIAMGASVAPSLLPPLVPIVSSKESKKLKATIVSPDMIMGHAQQQFTEAEPLNKTKI